MKAVSPDKPAVPPAKTAAPAPKQRRAPGSGNGGTQVARLGPAPKLSFSGTRKTLPKAKPKPDAMSPRSTSKAFKGKGRGHKAKAVSPGRATARSPRRPSTATPPPVAKGSGSIRPRRSAADEDDDDEDDGGGVAEVPQKCDFFQPPSDLPGPPDGPAPVLPPPPLGPPPPVGGPPPPVRTGNSPVPSLPSCMLWLVVVTVAVAGRGISVHDNMYSVWGTNATS